MATTSTPLSFRRTGRCATWVMAPAPTTATRRVSLIRRSPRCGSMQALECGRRIIRRQDLLVPLPLARTADGAPLAEADAVPRARAVDREPADPGAIRAL